MSSLRNTKKIGRTNEVTKILSKDLVSFKKGKHKKNISIANSSVISITEPEKVSPIPLGANKESTMLKDIRAK